MGSDALFARGQGLRLNPRRQLAREVAIGDVVVGGRRSIAVQSMTTTFTSDAAATAAQVAALARAGCDVVRVTVPSKPDAEALPEIRRLLAAEGVSVPLVADIHFTPRLALQVVEHVEKVRVNPGNFSDKKSLKGVSYDGARWDRDRERAYEQFAPLADRSRELGVSLRIGVNHGSLSDRLVERFGDTPEGMVESALEFIEFAEDRGHRELVISMKASIPQVMVQAYRLLADRLLVRGELYPLHLGVTEAGGGDDGRIKSAAGIATLLGEGLGDTIRVSLTEDPLAEVPVGRELVALFERPFGEESRSPVEETIDPLAPSRRATAGVELAGLNVGGDAVPAVELSFSPDEPLDLAAIARLEPPVEIVDRMVATPDALDAALDELCSDAPSLPARSLTLAPSVRSALLDDPKRLARARAGLARLALVLDEPTEDVAALAEAVDPLPLLVLLRSTGMPEDAARITSFVGTLAGAARNLLVGLAPEPGADVERGARLLAAALDRAGARIPLVLADGPLEDGRDPRLVRAGRTAPLLLDGIGDVLSFPANGDAAGACDLAHRVLQAARRRLERAEFIACPSCGRTLFDLEETTETIRELTGHLKLKIAVMGCVVNGPGEMADADYGFVGWGEGKVALFVGRKMVEKDLPFEEAPGRLIELIRSHGDWVDAPAASE